MRILHIVQVSVATAALTLLGAVPAGAAGTGPSTADQMTTSSTLLDCPGVKAVPGGYRLTQDVECVADWAEDNAVLDLARHTYTGRITPHGDGVTIRNGSLVLEPEYWADSHGLTVSHVTISKTSEASTAFFLEMGTGSVVDHCVLKGINGSALSYYFGTSGIVHDSLFLDNRQAITVQAGGGLLIERNVFRGNNTGVNLWNENGTLRDITLRGNVMIQNRFAGARIAARYVGAHSLLQNIDVRGNRFLHNGGTGLYLQVSCHQWESMECPETMDTGIRKNIFYSNGHTPAASMEGVNDGLTARAIDNKQNPYLPALAAVEVTGNIAGFNADLGLDAPGVLDGGHNLAHANGNSQECLGVICGWDNRANPNSADDVSPRSSATASAAPVAEIPDQYRH